MNHDLGIREVRSITNFLKEKQGVDYSEFALTSFKRRLEGFLALKKCGIDVLLKNLESKDFIDHFVGRIAVPETELFRDPTFWVLMKNNYIANLLKENQKIKIWAPLCASGEEYYSLAILLKENGWSEKVDVFVSSMSNETLENIRNGRIENEKLEISAKNYSRFQGTAQFTNYLKTSGNISSIDKSLFNNTKFFKESIAFEYEIPHVNLILFRNKFIYFNSSLQYRITDLLYNKLSVKGLLALGILEEVEGKFFPLNKNESVFQRRG